MLHTPTSVQVIDADEKVLHSAPLTDSRTVFPRPNMFSTGTSPSIAPRNLLSAIVGATWEAPSVYSFSTEWVVPPLPQRYSGQLLYYFIGLLPPSFDAIIQPVLQYGVSAAGGGAFWSVGSWYIVGSNAYYTNVTTLPAGTLSVEAFIINNDDFLGTPTMHAWYSVFEFNQASGLNIQTPEVFNWAYEALEIYNATTFQNLPDTTTNMQHISLATQENKYPSSIGWAVANDTADGITMNVVSSSAVTGALQIKYPGELF